MRVAVRVDASTTIGTGHLRRCLSLLSALTELKTEVCFVQRQHDTVGMNVMKSFTCQTHWLAEPQPYLACEDPGPVAHAPWAGVPWQQDAAETIAALKSFAPDWLVVDHYAFDARWHDEVRLALGCGIVVIDDLGDRALSADILLDSNASENHRVKYANRLQREPRYLTGIRFALLSPTYRSAPRYIFQDNVQSIGVFMGGTDPNNISAHILQTLRTDTGFQGQIEIASSSSNIHNDRLARLCAEDGHATLSLDLADLSAFFARHDLQIGAGGTASYERCCIGAPTISLAIAENQLAVIPILEEMGVIQSAVLPHVEETHWLPDAPPLASVAQNLMTSPAKRRQMSENSRALVDAKGAGRVALAMLISTMTVRPATMMDGAMLHAWRNHPTTRSMSINTEEIILTDHLSWLGAAIADKSRTLLVACIEDRPVGTIRFDFVDEQDWLVSLYLDPDLHGLGIGKQMLLTGERALAAQSQDGLVFRAKVVEGNVASARLFEGAGYSGGPTEYWKNCRELNE
jgi:UDP-2,4-diacetamido-2,4,6-trideoxy-beta-L-altropyranose hydrolase